MSLFNFHKIEFLHSLKSKKKKTTRNREIGNLAELSIKMMSGTRRSTAVSKLFTIKHSLPVVLPFPFDDMSKRCVYSQKVKANICTFCLLHIHNLNFIDMITNIYL